MPAYQSGNAIAAYPGDEVTLWAWEMPAVGGSSQAVSVAQGVARAGAVPVVSIAIQFAEAPTAEIAVQAANDDHDANYVQIASSINTSPELLVVNVAAAFVRLQLLSQAVGGAITATLRRAA